MQGEKGFYMEVFTLVLLDGLTVVSSHLNPKKAQGVFFCSAWGRAWLSLTVAQEIVSKCSTLWGFVVLM